MKTKQELQQQLNIIRDQLYEIEMEERAIQANALLGKCFRYKNSYSCPQKESDYWYEYFRADRVVDGNIQGLQFSQDSVGTFRLIEKETKPYHIAGWEKITKAEFNSKLRSFNVKIMNAQD